MLNYKKKIISIVLDNQNIKRDLNRALEINSSLPKDGFWTYLFILFMKSDKENYEKLKQMYPKQALEFEKYKKFGIDPGENYNSET